MSVARDPFLLLRELERRSRKMARGLPQAEVRRSRWEGVGFRMGEGHFVAPVGSALEMLTLPTATRIPGVRSWVAGVANVRGRLVTIIDLAACLGGEPARTSRASRVLVVRQKDTDTGLLVDEVVGLKHFDPDREVSAKGRIADFAESFVDRAFEDEERLWGVVDLRSLVERPEFFRVAR